MELFIIGLLLFFSGGLISLLFPEKLKATIVSLFSFFGTLGVSIPALQILFNGGLLGYNFNLPYPIGTVSLIIDPLSAFFIVVISIMSFLGCVYSIGYMKTYLNKNKNTASHFLFLSILITSMLGVVTIQNSFFFLIVWEIMSLSSFFLVIFENDKKEVISSGINYLITMHISVLLIAIGFIILILKTGNMDFSSFKIILESNKFFANLVFICFFVGFGIKAGFVPFHTWLPKAHPVAPSHISGIMSGVMIKTGIYGVLRILSLINIPTIEISYFVLIISLLTALFGILYAVAQQNMKRLLAYSSVENIGIIGIGIAIGMFGLVFHNDIVAILGFSGGILHILNHSIFKSLLFYGAGSVYKQTHTKNIEKLGGLIKTMPKTAVLFLIGSLAISGLPPFNGFISEVLIYLGFLKSFKSADLYTFILFVISIASLALVGTMAILCFTKVFSISFLGTPRSEESDNVKEDVSKIMFLPMSALALFSLMIGLFPQYAVKVALSPAIWLVRSHSIIEETLIPMQLLRSVSLSCFIFLAIIALVFILRKFLMINKNISGYKTWDCGYQTSNSRIQYTASSYVSPFLSMLKPFLIKNFDIKKAKDLFPKVAYFELHIKDIFEFYIINPVIKADKRFLAFFHWIQNGNSQQYILYGLIFLVVALLGTIIF